MNIAFDHQIFGWQQFGGISRYAYELATGLSKLPNQNVSVISPLYINHYLTEAPDSLKVTGISVPHLPKTGRIYREVNALLAKPIAAFHQPDIVHETYYSRGSIAPKKAKIVLTVYDMIHERFKDNFSKADPTCREKAMAVARADHIICISEQTRADLIQFLNVNPAKTSVVHLGFSLTCSSANQANKSDQPFLLYVGSRGGYKNFIGLVKAYASSAFLNKNFKLISFGGGTFTTNEKQLFKELGINSDQILQISGDDALLASYYQSANAFIYPSLYEGFGIPPLEAMSFNCPVVCSNVSSIPEVVGNAAEMFDPHDFSSIQISIEKVLQDSIYRNKLIELGKKRLDIFSWDRCVTDTFSIYQQLSK